MNLILCTGYKIILCTDYQKTKGSLEKFRRFFYFLSMHCGLCCRKSDYWRIFFVCLRAFLQCYQNRCKFYTSEWGFYNKTPGFVFCCTFLRSFHMAVMGFTDCLQRMCMLTDGFVCYLRIPLLHVISVLVLLRFY